MKYENNHAAALRGEQHYNRKQVLYLTGMSEQQLTDMQYFLLSEWLSYFHRSHTPEEWLIGEGIFKWWVYVWNEGDEQVLPKLYALSGKQYACLACYRRGHQYIFDPINNPQAGRALIDFNSLADDFIKEMKAATAPAISNIPEGHPSPAGRRAGDEGNEWLEGINGEGLI